MNSSTARKRSATKQHSRSKRPKASSKKGESETLVARAQRLLATEPSFIMNASFKGRDADSATDLAEFDEAAREQTTDVPRGLPAHLARLCRTPLLKPDEEAALFRRMNFAKFKATQACRRIDLDHLNVGAVEEAESRLAEAARIRDRIVNANMRLAISVVKKFVTPQFSFDDLLSDGIYSLLQAVEKFDYARGFRFSTYAYRAITRNVYRKVNDSRRDMLFLAADSSNPAIEPADENGEGSARDAALERLRGTLLQLVDQLDRRERFIIRSRYALGSHRKVRTFQALADRLGVSKERVRQLERRAVGKLQRFASESGAAEMAEPVFG